MFSVIIKDIICIVMKELHLKEGVLTGEECMDVYTSRIAPGVWTDSNLILILATKPKEQCELAMMILKSSSIWYLHRKLPRRYINVYGMLYYTNDYNRTSGYHSMLVSPI